MKLIRRLLRLPIVLDNRGVEKSQHYDDITNGLFTKPIKIGPRASAWPEDEVAALNAARIAGWTDDEIRKLVVQLEATRKVVNLADYQDSHCLRQFFSAGQKKPAKAAKEVV